LVSGIEVEMVKPVSGLFSAIAKECKKSLMLQLNLTFSQQSRGGKGSVSGSREYLLICGK